MLYQIQGKYVEAELLYQRALAINEKALGPSHPDTATTLNNLVGLYQNQGNYNEAEPLHQRALTVQEKTLGHYHSDVVQSFSKLAGLYQAQGNISQAIAHHHKETEVEETNLVVILITGSERRKNAYMATISGTTDTVLSLHLQTVHIFTTSAGSNTKLRQLITPNFGRMIFGGPLSRNINRKIGLENG